MDTTTLASTTALVLFSGGQDSTTCLAWALNRYKLVYTLGFDYGQRHHIEMICRKNILEAIPAIQPLWSTRLQQDTVLTFDIFRHIGENSLVSDIPIAPCASTTHDINIPNTFVPGRNLFFITAAAALAWKLHCRHIILGVCETDSSGYPDCRDDAVKAMQVAINTGMDARFVLHSPLMWLDKAATWQMAQDEGGQSLIELVRIDSHTCYEGYREHLHSWGYGCGKCPACVLRARGWDIFSRNT